MSLYVKRLAELAVVGFFTGGAASVKEVGFDLSQNGVVGLLAAAGFAAYGLVVKRLGEDVDRPTVK
jgi:hypothetical protein